MDQEPYCLCTIRLPNSSVFIQVPYNVLVRSAPVLAKHFDPQTKFAPQTEYVIPEEFQIDADWLIRIQGLWSLSQSALSRIEAPESVWKFLDFVGSDYLLQNTTNDHIIYMRALSQEDAHMEFLEYQYRETMTVDPTTDEHLVLRLVDEKDISVEDSSKDAQNNVENLRTSLKIAECPLLPYPCLYSPVWSLVGSARSRSLNRTMLGLSLQRRLYGVIKNINWDVFFLAGGSLTNVILGRRIMDLDFFLITRDPEQAEREIRAFASWLEPQGMTRTKHAVTLFREGFPPIQIILRLYHTRQQVLSGFDLDSCTVGYDGHHLVFMPRFERALRTMTNYVNPERQSTTYVHRLFKYMTRGFALAMPGLSELHLLPTRHAMMYRLFRVNDRVVDRMMLEAPPLQSDYSARVMEILGANVNPPRSYTATAANSTDSRIRRTPLQALLELEPQVALHSDYDGWEQCQEVEPPQFRQRGATTQFAKLCWYVSTGKRKGVHIAHDIESLLRIDMSQPGYLRTWDHLGDVPLNVTFVMEMPHGQRSGSFCPTNHQWFKGILY